MTRIASAGEEPLQRFDWTAFESLSNAVVTLVADEANADPTSIEPLYSVVDTDALNSILRPAPGRRAPVEASVEFEYLGYRVTVHAHGRGYLHELSGGIADEPKRSRRTDRFPVETEPPVEDD